MEALAAASQGNLLNVCFSYGKSTLPPSIRYSTSLLWFLGGSAEKITIRVEWFRDSALLGNTLMVRRNQAAQTHKIIMLCLSPLQLRFRPCALSVPVKGFVGIQNDSIPEGSSFVFAKPTIIMFHDVA